MAREKLSTVTTKLFDEHGRHVADRVDEYFIDKRDGMLVQAQQPRTPKPHTPPPAQPRPERPLAARGHAPTIQSYTAPDTLAVVVAMQRGETLLEYAPAAPARSLLACKACGRVVLCRCGTPAQPALDEVLKVQQAMGRW